MTADRFDLHKQPGQFNICLKNYRRRDRSVASVCVLLAIGCSFAGLAAAQETRSKAEVVQEDSAKATPSGATFKVPAGWSLESAKDLQVITPPEPDSHIAIFDAGAAASAQAAVTAAWAALKGSQTHPLKLVSPLPARDGWDERQFFSYETSPNERAVVQAIALRAGTAWTVVLVDGTDPTFEKRQAPANSVFESLRPKGYQKEMFAGKQAHPLDAVRIAQLAEFVQSSMKELGIPGVGLALLDHDKVVFEGGFGVRELGKPEPVDENTLFMAASNTKGMTTLMLSELVDQGKLRWDEPVVQVYPSFKLGDAETTKQVLVKNLICACTGMPRQDLEWLFNFKNSTAESEVQLLGTMQPTSKYGEVYQYSNLMASAAGYIGGHIEYPRLELGAAYDKTMQNLVFDPLHMNATTFDYAKALAGNHASPHGDDIDGKPAVASMAFNYSIYPARPAGGVWTSSADLIKYVQLEMDKGKLPDGKQLVSAENLLARRAPQVPIGEDDTYGMGLEVSTKYGVTVVSHGGSMSGFKTNWFLLPDSQIGAVILTNSDTGNMLVYTFGRRLLEVLFDGKPEAESSVASSAANYQASLKKERERLVVPPAPELVAKLATKYNNEKLGEIDVSGANGQTVFDFGVWKSAVASRKNDDGSVSFVTIDPSLVGFEFVVGEKDGRRTLTIRDGQHEYVFTEVA
jgi:CubicO group peptidase (beta-lactamase class C family)